MKNQCVASITNVFTQNDFWDEFTHNQYVSSEHMQAKNCSYAFILPCYHQMQVDDQLKLTWAHRAEIIFSRLYII